MSGIRLRLGVCALGLGLGGFITTAGAVTQIPQPLTLNAALDWAGDNNPTLRAAKIRVEQLTGESIHADVAVPSNPRIEFGAGQRSTAGGDGTDLNIQLSQEFWVAGQGALRESAANRELAAARDQYRYLVSATTARVRAAFLSVLVAEKAVTTARRVVKANQALYDYAKRRMDAGAGTLLELNAAQLGVSRATALLAQAKNRRQGARLALDDLLGIDPRRTLAVAGKLSIDPLRLPDRADLLERAARQRSDLVAAAGRVAAARERLKLADRQIIPNLTVFGFYREENGGDGQGPLRRGATIAGGGVSFELPVLHRYAGERKQAAAALDRAQLERENLQRDVRLEVIGALSDYRSARTQVEALNSAVFDAAQQSVELTKRAFQAGEVGAPAITAAQNNLISVRAEYLSALEGLINATTDLERATGGLIAVAADNAHTGAQ
ncbi:MAG: transporter [Xanthomonadales bacterium]|nr:transporter [Xanthomonadales bacterium]|tara:strand:+ start:1235 stop:2554 length:1320 start_codon:yes stop_codon:yes gene_type:complete